MSDPATMQRWTLPAVEGPVVSRRLEAGASDVDIYDRSGTAASQKRGYEAGIAAGRAEMQVRINELAAQVARLESVFNFLSHPLQELDAEVEKQLTFLALTVGKQVLRRELKAEPTQIIAIIRESVGRLPAAAREIRVHLHPEDAAIVRAHLSQPNGERAWSVIDDPSLSRGGCMVRSETSQIDARLESRLNAIMSTVLGEERAAERGVP